MYVLKIKKPGTAKWQTVRRFSQLGIVKFHAYNFRALGIRARYYKERKYAK